MLGEYGLRRRDDGTCSDDVMNACQHGKNDPEKTSEKCAGAWQCVSAAMRMSMMIQI
jgi:hypothetical protein